MSTNHDDATATKPLLSIADLSRKYGLPESTARYYCKRFRDFIPHEGQGKRRRYRQEGVAVFEAILEEMKNNKNANAVEAALELKFPRLGQATEASSPGAAAPAQGAGGAVESLLREQNQVLERIAKALEEKAGGEESPAPVAPAGIDDERATAMEQRIEALTAEIESLRKMQDEAEQIHQNDLEQLRKWLGHLAQEQSKGR